MSTTPQDTSTWDVLNGELYQTLRMGNNSYHPILEVTFEVRKREREGEGGEGEERREGEGERGKGEG